MKSADAPVYSLVEIFESLQGEGRNTGRPCVFVRFAGCNLSCPWCDTDVSCRFSATLEELVGEIAAFRAKSVVLTGGEPTLVEGMPELVAELKSRGYWIAVHCRDRFAFLVCAGITTLLALQVFLNVAVVTNLLPCTGISLPFFSYGGTALLIQLFELGIVLSASRDFPEQ